MKMWPCDVISLGTLTTTATDISGRLITTPRQLESGSSITSREGRAAMRLHQRQILHKRSGMHDVKMMVSTSSEVVRYRARIRRVWLLTALCIMLYLDTAIGFSVDNLSIQETRPRRPRSRKIHRRPVDDNYLQGGGYYSSCLHMSKADDGESIPSNNSTDDKLEGYAQRISQLEQVVARQEVLIQKLRTECSDLTEASVAFARVIELLRQAGLDTPPAPARGPSLKKLRKDRDSDEDEDDEDEEPMIFETYDDTEIFGSAPSSIIDAADAAGAAILAGMLGGKQRMLVDVRDAELSRDPEVLVQFIELAILPVAAGLEGIRSTRNRVKIVFATVSQLLQYRRTMALAAPEVVALSTLGFDPIEKQDQVVVLIAPSPDDDEGLLAMNELLSPTDPAAEQITQPLVVVNPHMVPVSGPARDFEVAYHLRLLSVQYMSGGSQEQEPNMEAYEEQQRMLKEEFEAAAESEEDESEEEEDDSADPRDEDEALEAAMKHAHEIGMQQGVTRAMVIRAYPK